MLSKQHGPCLQLIVRVLHRRFTGIEFALVHAQPPSAFIIHKRERLSPEEGGQLLVHPPGRQDPEAITSSHSAAARCLFHHELQNLPVTGCLYRTF